MISAHQPSDYLHLHDNLTATMAFRNDPYLNSSSNSNSQQYSTDAMLWDMPQNGGGSALLNPRGSSGSAGDMNNGAFAALRKPPQTGFSTGGEFGGESNNSNNYSSFGSTGYGSSIFAARNERENFNRSGESPNSGLPSLSGAPASRPVAVNGNFSRSMSTGQGSPSTTPGFASSPYTNASPFAASSQYSGQNQSLNLNSFNVSSMKSGSYEDPLQSRSSMMKRQQMEAAKRASNMGMPSPYGSSAFMRGNMFNQSNGSEGAVFDMSEFPSLATRNRMENSLSFANILAQPKTGYGMLKEGSRENNPEFQMQQEDFPALPGAEGGASLPGGLAASRTFEKEKAARAMAGESTSDRATPNSTSSMNNSLSQQLGYGQASSSSNTSLNTYFQPGPGILHGMPPYRNRMMTEPGERSSMAPAPPIRRPEEASGFTASGTAPKVVYVPPTIVQDHFGLFGFLQYMKCLPGNTSLPLTSVGCDLHALGLVFNPLDATPKRFKGYPFLHSYISDACTAHICHLDVDVPSEYLVSITMPKDKVAPPRISRFSEDLLFYLFYGFPGDIMQFAAAMELYTRDWRFHKDEKVWITRIPNQPPMEKTNTYERGQYQYFDSLGWRKASKEMHVEYAKLDERATFPNSAVQLMPNFLQSLFN